MLESRAFEALISPGELANLLDTASVALFDVRFSLSDAAAGRRLYEESHIPGAFFLDLDRDLSGKITGTTGRHPLPDAALLAERLRTCGVNNDTQIIAYDDSSGAFAARLWWLCKWLGHDRVAVLNGGFAEWKGSGHPVSNTIPDSRKGRFQESVRKELLVTTAELLERLNGDAKITLVDARAPERYRGDTEPLDKVAGHIPGAINLPFSGNLGKDGFFLSAEALKNRHRTTAPAVHMCGSGVTACHNVLASFAAGLGMPRLYAGSWSEWITDPSRPVETSTHLPEP